MHKTLQRYALNAGQISGYNPRLNTGRGYALPVFASITQNNYTVVPSHYKT